MLAVNSAKGPHIDGDDVSAQVGEAQRRIHIQPGIIRQFRRRSEVWQGGVDNGQDGLQRL